MHDVVHTSEAERSKPPSSNMGLDRILPNRIIGFLNIAAVGSVAAFFITVRDSKLVPLSTCDYIFKSDVFKQLNPNNNPTTHDLVLRKVPFSKIKPELLKDQAKLTERFCAGVWGGKGYRYQRLYMQYKYRGPETAHQLWDVPELQSSTYHVGTQITDHFEVVSKTPESIVVRCGGSPRIREVRPGEGLFEMCTHLSEKEGVVEFGLKSAFFAGLDKADAPPMSGLMKWLHVQYAKLWMEHAIKNVTV